jgi:hypothetical protein
MNSRNLSTLKIEAPGGQMWGPNPHSLNIKIIPSRIEIFISNLLTCYMACIFNIYGMIY